MANYDVRDKVVLITGAAQGIGAESARRLAERGARLALLDLDGAAADERAAELGPQAIAFEVDVTDWSALERAVDGTLERFGAIDVVMANAGIGGPVQPVAAVPPEEFEQVIEVNLLGAWRTIKVALPHVIARQGYVLSTASLAAALQAPLMAPYAATKAGLEAFSNSLRQEVHQTGTRVGVAYFGFIDTKLVSDAFANPAAAKMRETMPGIVRAVAPLHDAGEAVVRGIEKRSRAVYAPRWVLPVLLARGIIQPLSELQTRGRPELAEAIRIAEAESGTQPPAPERSPAAGA